jgi:hypothetical protein
MLTFEQMLNSDVNSWKEPNQKSALSVRYAELDKILTYSCRWYNEPITTEEADEEDGGFEYGNETMEDQEEEDSHPIDFDTFVPTHNPALQQGSKLPNQLGLAPVSNIASTSRDEAFQHAVQASYWAGYWTAIYHVGFPSKFEVFLRLSQSKSGNTVDAATSNEPPHDAELDDATQEEEQIVVDGMLPAGRDM